MQLGVGVNISQLEEIVTWFFLCFFSLAFQTVQYCEGGGIRETRNFNNGCHTGCFAGNSGPPEFSPVRTGLSLVPGQRLKRNPELHPFGNPRGFFVAEIFSEDDIQGFSR